MGNIINLFKTAEPARIVQPPSAVKHEYTLKELKAYDYRGVYQDALNRLRPRNGATVAKLLKTKFRIIDLAYGALIATRLKEDAEAAEVLIQLFARALETGTQYGTLSDLPEFARGYAWMYDPVLAAYARATVTGPKPS